MKVKYAGKKHSLRGTRQKKMDEIMVAQDNVALGKSQIYAFNRRKSDPAWFDEMRAAFAADTEIIEASSGANLRGPNVFKRLALLVDKHLPNRTVEVVNAFGLEDQVVIETVCWRNSGGPQHLPTGTLPAQAQGLERMCFVFRIRDGKIISLRIYYDLFSQLERFALVPETD